MFDEIILVTSQFKLMAPTLDIMYRPRSSNKMCCQLQPEKTKVTLF